MNGIAIASHDHPLSCLRYISEASLLVTGSWDGTVKFLDTRTRSVVTEYSLPTKILCIATDGHSAFCGCSERTIFRFETRNLDHPESMQTSFAYRTRSIAANKSYLATGACEGRVAIQSFDDSSLFYAFKAHVGSDDQKFAYPVNSMCFKGDSDQLVTGGSDGLIRLWDVRGRRILQTLGNSEGDQFPTSVASLSFAETGGLLAAAISYCHEFGDQDHPPDQLVIYSL
jgi:cell cycle arrest protein BUB3